MYDVYSQIHTDEVMSFADAVAIYNEVAEKYNAVMALYDTCDCGNTHSTGSKERIPLYDPETTPAHRIGIFPNYKGYDSCFWSAGELNQCECVGYDNSHGSREGCGILEVVAGLSKRLESISLKQHGPLNTYCRNGYVQLYTPEAYLDPETDTYVDNTNGLGVDFPDNKCSDIDTLITLSGGSIDSSTFSETKIYPIITTVDPEKIDSTLTTALSTFNTVAALPKMCDYPENSVYEVNFAIRYKITSDNTGPNPIGLFTKSDYDAILPDIYSDFINILYEDYDNWLNDQPRTLDADLRSLEQAYTVVNNDDLVLRQLTIFAMDPPEYDLSVPFPYSYSYYATAHYTVPAVSYFVDNSIEPGIIVCKSADIELISLRVTKIPNKYSTDLYLEGFEFPDVYGKLIAYREHENNPTFSFVDREQSRYFNTLGHLTSVNKSQFLLTVAPCDYMLLLPTQDNNPVDLISSFPTRTWDWSQHWEFPPNDQNIIWGSAVIYNNTTYYNCYPVHTPESHFRLLTYTPYLKLQQEPTNESSGEEEE